MPTPRRRTLLVTFTASVWAVSGCAYFTPTPRLNPGPAEQYVGEDLPTPEGFVLDREGSLRHERTNFRRLKLLYNRGEYFGEERVAEFVKSYYPQAGWQVDFMYGLNTHKFILSKGPEECLIEVKTDRKNRATELVMEVHPRTTDAGEVVARPATARRPQGEPLPPIDDPSLEVTRR